MPAEKAISQVMQETGMARMQAIYHLRAREIVRQRAAAETAARLRGM